MKLRAKQRAYQFPYLYDGETQRTSTAFGVLATPHVFIFDRQRKLRYVGRIDDSDVKTPKSHDARNAIDALLAGKPVPVETTRVFGCSTKWLDKRASAAESLAKWNQEKATLETIGVEGVKKLAANDTKKLRLVNVWATYCGPCVAELGEFVTMHRMYRRRNFELVTISLDTAAAHDAALGVLNDKHVSAANYRYDGDDKDALAEALDKQWPGPLPYTLLIAPGGKIIYRHTGEIEPLEVKRAVVEYLGRTY